MEKPFVMSAIAFLLELAAFVSASLLMIRHRDRSQHSVRRRVATLTTATVFTAVVALVTPASIFYNTPAALATVYPAIIIAIALALLMPIVLGIAYRRWSTKPSGREFDQS
jgi:cytochrome bd-type quinol oxidase subunit 2